ncbi:trypsin-like serine protease [Streptomyces sp. NPDC002566]|uniref:trypsin-like serine protease n=1 Tax=Streptomyces sp. NPDC002566 TaxID=3364650 RepID=UPI0036ABA07E
MHTRVTRTAIAVTAVAALTALVGSNAYAVDTSGEGATEVMPFAFEDGAYPNAAKTEADKGIKLIRGDGNITLASCNLDAKQIRVQVVGPPVNKQEMYCFVSRASTGLLTLDLNRAFWIDAADQPVTATLTAEDGTTKAVTIPKDGYAPVGEGVVGGNRSRLVEIRVTGPIGTAPAPSDATLAFTGKLTVGDSKRFCTATLVDPRWVLTAKSCFADNPVENNTVAAGAPKERTSVTVGRTDLATSGGHITDIVELMPHADRDLVMGRLAQPATGISPVALSSTAAVDGEELTTAGFGRTATEWAPSKLHTASFTVGAVAEAGFAITAKTPADASVCKGDAGAPTLRTEAGKPALVALVSRSWQTNCLDGRLDESKSGAYDTRVDDLRSWVEGVKASRPVNRLFAIGGDEKIHANSGDYDTASEWTSFAHVPGSSSMKQISAVAMGDKVRLFAIGGDGRIYGANGDYSAGTWSAFKVVPGDGAFQRISAVAMGDKVRLFAIGGDGRIYGANGDYSAGTWSAFKVVPGDGAFQRISAVAMGDKVRLFAIGGDGRIYGANGDYTAGTWSAFKVVPGTTGIKYIATTAVGDQVHLFAVGSDAKIKAAIGDYAAGTWSAFKYMASSGIQGIAATTLGDKVRLFAIGSDSQIWTADKETAGTWSAFTAVHSSGIKDISTTATSS